MDESSEFDHNVGWVAGFEGDRRIVLSRIGPWRKVFECPPNYVPRPHHQVFELGIEDWTLHLAPPPLSQLLKINASLDIRFQPTLGFARRHLEHLDNLGRHLRAVFQPLLVDAAEDELRELESGAWLEIGHGALERRIEMLIQELLALQEVQSRCRCRIEATFTKIDAEQLHKDIHSTDPARNLVALQLLRQQRDSQERLAREQHEQALLEQRIRLEQQKDLLEIEKQATDLVRAQEAEATERERERIQAEEQRKLEKIASEGRLIQERLRIEAEIRELEVRTSIDEKNRRESSYPEVQAHLQREIELLAMERQRLALEDEIHKTKKSRALGWFSGLRGNTSDPAPEDGEKP